MAIIRLEMLLAAVVSALLDALAPLGVRDLEMPATPDRLWRVMASARSGRSI